MNFQLHIYKSNYNTFDIDIHIRCKGISFSMLQKQPFLPYFKQRGFVFKYKLIAVHQRYEAAAISIRKALFKCTLKNDE